MEAANIAARMGASVLMITSHIDLVGQMSCNPAIGGVAKGNLVREVDALGGLMGKVIDRAGIHFRMLNRSKGMAVWGNRAQADKIEYRRVMRVLLDENERLNILQEMVCGIDVKAGCACGVKISCGEHIGAGAVVIAAGTFMNGLAHVGLETFPCGRSGEPRSMGLSESLQEYGIRAGRLKTGTPVRIDGRSVDFSKMTRQTGDDEPWPFSFSTTFVPQNKAVCWVTKTNRRTHDIIRENLDRSPLYTGRIQGVGPRYCPSIEDKVVRFGDRDGHTLFLEPEGVDHQEMYLNGMATSLPLSAQVQMVHSVRGLERAWIVRPAYAIEYDYFDPLQLHETLESQVVPRLFLAGQINGTSGYEEAASQGIMAGINAAARVMGLEPMVLGRETAYTGVLIDDLVTRGTEEPYRMFTSRAEYRLLLRQDNVDERLMPLAAERGLVDRELLRNRQRLWEQRDRATQAIATASVIPERWTGRPIRHKVSAMELLRRPDVTLDEIDGYLGVNERVSGRELRLRVEADVKYEGFVRKQERQIARLRKMEDAAIPVSVDYDTMVGLLTESRAKLKKIRPHTLGQASRVPGVTPADVSVLITHMGKRRD